MKFNINNKVRVKLTSLGHSIHRANHMKLYHDYLPESRPAYVPVEQNDDGWSTWICWDLMHEFGQHLHNGISVEGGNIPFEPEIELLESGDI